jgi:hypothetical protein
MRLLGDNSAPSSRRTPQWNLLVVPTIEDCIIRWDGCTRGRPSVGTPFVFPVGSSQPPR